MRVRVEVPGGAGEGYDVVVEPGCVRSLGDALGALDLPRRVAVISDANVARLHGAEVMERLRAADYAPSLFEFPAGEASKSRARWAELTDAMLSAGFGRDSFVVALGGGVAGDLAGFVAATYMRGVPLVQVPTTLLAMVDASVGGKTGVDVREGKNLVGAFHFPRIVLADPTLLGTLPERELRSGLAEALKHGAIADASYFDFIAGSARRLAARDADALARVVARSIEIKARVVSEDPFEAGERAVLNFGHTVAHAVELATGYGLPHGDAVAFGMCVEAALGVAQGITEPGTDLRVREAVESCGLPVRLPASARVEEVLRALPADKKSRGGAPRCVFLQRVGAVAREPDGRWTHGIEIDRLRSLLL